MDSTAQIAPKGSKIINETASTGDARIGQRKHPVGTQISSKKLLPRVTHGFNSANSPRAQNSLRKLLPRVTHGFDCVNRP